MLKTRMALVPITQLSSKFLPLVIIGGFFFLTITGLINLGIGVYTVLTLFHLVTLPVEFNASKRAKVELVGLGIIDKDEMPRCLRNLECRCAYLRRRLLGVVAQLALVDRRAPRLIDSIVFTKSRPLKRAGFFVSGIRVDRLAESLSNEVQPIGVNVFRIIEQVLARRGWRRRGRAGPVRRLR